MAVLGLGISDSATTSAYASLRRIVEKNYPSAQYVVFSTELGAEFQEYIDVSCSFRYVKRPGDAGSDNGWSQWSQWYWSHIPSSQCRPHQTPYDSRWHWAIELSQIGQYLDGGTTPNPGGSIKNMLFGSSYALEQRKYDGIQMQIHVKTCFYEQYWESQGGQFSDVAQNNSIVYSYVPNYYLSSITITAGGYIDISYEAPAWQRNDDRFGVEIVRTSTGENLLNTDDHWGNILGYSNGYGFLRIPYSLLKRAVGSDEDIYVKIRMNAGFNSIDQWFGYLEGTKNVNNQSVCSTPILSVMSADVNSVQIRLYDSHDEDVSYESALCTLYGNYLETDMEWVENGGIYTILDPPLGVDFEVSAVGRASVSAGTETAYSKNSAWVTVPAIKGESKTIITPYDTDALPVEARYNVSENWTYEPEQERVKFATRKLDSVASGYGGSAHGTLEFDIVDDKRYGEDMYQDSNDFQNLLFTGVCVLRGPDGERRRVTIESVDIDWDRYRRFKTVKIGMRQVQ